MRHVAAYLLAVLGGNSNPSAADLKGILSSVGIEADSKNLSIVVDQLNGKNINEVLAQGRALLVDMPVGGGSSTAPASSEAAAPVEEVKEEKKAVVEESESDSDMGMGLFD